jgi:chromate reductase, NAD(P)H dehydrogenase (quinone)
MNDLTLLGICGSLRRASWNRRLMHEAARDFGGRFVDGDIRFPLYDGDLEAEDGLPAAVSRLADGIRAADAVILVTPEYNQSFSSPMKNAIDWLSRVKGNPWLRKPVAILSAADGRSGGARAQYALRLAVNKFRMRLLTGPEVLVANAAHEFDADGRLTSERYRKVMADLMGELRAEALRGRQPEPAPDSPRPG